MFLSPFNPLHYAALHVRSEVGQRTFLRLEAAHPYLVQNPHLSESVWQSLWAQKLPAQLVAHLVSHTPSPAAVDQVIARERRKTVLHEFVRSVVLNEDQAAALLASKAMSSDLALSWMYSGNVPEALSYDVAVLAGPNGIFEWAATTTSSDADIVRALVTQLSSPPAPVPPQILKMLDKRPRIAQLLIASGVPEFAVWACASRHLFGTEPFAAALTMVTANSIGSLITLGTELAVNPNTPVSVLEDALALVAEHRSSSIALSVLRHRLTRYPYAITVPWEQVSDEREILLVRSYAMQRPSRMASIKNLPAFASGASSPVHKPAVPPALSEHDAWNLPVHEGLIGWRSARTLPYVEPVLDAAGESAWDAFALLLSMERDVVGTVRDLVDSSVAL